MKIFLHCTSASRIRCGGGLLISNRTKHTFCKKTSRPKARWHKLQSWKRRLLFVQAAHLCEQTVSLSLFRCWLVGPKLFFSSLHEWCLSSTVRKRTKPAHFILKEKCQGWRFNMLHEPILLQNQKKKEACIHFVILYIVHLETNVCVVKVPHVRQIQFPVAQNLINRST